MFKLALLLAAAAALFGVTFFYARELEELAQVDALERWPVLEQEPV